VQRSETKIRGTVTPFWFIPENLTLDMRDGREVKFFFKDQQGSIAGSWTK
jgi:hypothetical protein